MTRKPHFLGFPCCLDSVDACQYVHTSGRQAALAVGLRSDDTEDCAIEFVEHMLGRVATSQAWLSACALRFALNYRRHHKVICSHELPLDTPADYIPDPRIHCDPERVVLLRESLEEVKLALEQVSARDAELLWSFYFAGESIAVISERSGRSQHAIGQALYRGRKRLVTVIASTSSDSAKD